MLCEIYVKNLLHMLLNKIIICRIVDCIYAFAYSDDKLVFVTEDFSVIHSESIFRGKITKLNLANRSAFIEYLPGITGFINLPTKLNVQCGSILPVQLTWLGDESKQAKLRHNWCLVGKYMVYAGDKPVRIQATQISQELRDKLTRMLTEFPAHWIVRSCVNDALYFDCVAAEIKLLYQQASAINASSALGQIYFGVSNYLKLIRASNLAKGCEIISNDQEIHQSLLMYQDLWQIDLLSFDPLFNASELIAQQQNLLATKLVNLANGASLEINTVSGITLIDVNSSRLNLSGHKLNFLVLDAIYQQICLRNLQGVILLDLIKNMSESEQHQIINYLTKLFKHDITNTKILGFSHSGLCEIIRNKF